MEKINPEKMPHLFRKLMIAAIIFWVGFASTAVFAQTAQPGKDLFDKKCRACHSIGGGVIVGPDLQGVAQRRDRTWLQNFILTPDKVIASGDPIALQLLQTHNNIPMPNLGLTTADVDSLIAYLENPQGTPGAGTGAAAPPLTGDPSRGKLLFDGQTALQNGGFNCIACHSIENVAALGGGSLGPDLTLVVQRYGGEAAMAGVLAGLPFPTMQGVFLNRPLSPQEQADLLAYFVQAGQAPAPRLVNVFTIWYLALAGGGALILFGLMAIFWPGQRRSLSDRLRKSG